MTEPPPSEVLRELVHYDPRDLRARMATELLAAREVVEAARTFIEAWDEADEEKAEAIKRALRRYDTVLG